MLKFENPVTIKSDNETVILLCNMLLIRNLTTHASAERAQKSQQ